MVILPFPFLSGSNDKCMCIASSLSELSSRSYRYLHSQSYRHLAHMHKRTGATYKHTFEHTFTLSFSIAHAHTLP